MHSFRLIADSMLLYLVRTPLIVLAVVCVLLIAAAAVLVFKELRRLRSDTCPPEDTQENTPCC